MKKRCSLLVVFLLCLTLPLSAMAEFAFVQLGANLYAQADTASGVVSAYGAGTWVEIVEGDGAAEDDGFVNVIGPDGINGYVPETEIFILSQTAADQIAVVANGGKYVNLRAGASKSAQILAKVNSGTPMTLLETSGGFDRVQIGDLEGYMMSSLLKTGLRPIYSPYVESANYKSVNLRSEPSMNGDILATVPYDGQVSVYMLGGGWAYIRYGNIDGYMMSKFLVGSNPIPTPGPTYGPIPTVQPTYGPVPNPDPDSDFWEVNMTCYVSNNGSSVRYRSGPGGSARVLGKLASGTEVFVLSTNGAWSKFVLGTGSDPAYIMSEYLVTIMPDPDPDPDPWPVPVPDPDPDPEPYIDQTSGD